MDPELEKFVDSVENQITAKRLDDRKTIEERLSDHPIFSCVYAGRLGDVDDIVPTAYHKNNPDEMFVTYVESFYQDTIDGKPIIDFMLHGFSSDRTSMKNVPVRTRGTLYATQDDTDSTVYNIESMRSLPKDYDPLVHYEEEGL
ncbi:MAG: hypothetical protein ACLFNK_02215 [Candidatus Woesearchaeota archaeon]